MRTLRAMLAALAVPALTGLATAGEPAHANQQLADSLARQLRGSGQFSGYVLDIETDGGIVTLSGTLSDSAQHAQLLNMARRHPGVVSVVDDVRVANKQPLIAASFTGHGHHAAEPVDAGGHEMVMEPAPIQSFPGGVAAFSDAPVLPPYSWPAYTPYNNFASMAYQTQYPSGAWPFVGPPYPYPMIPSGWRSVSLKWKKGYWWLKFNAH